MGTSVRFASALTADEKQKRKQEGTLCTRCGERVIRVVLEPMSNEGHRAIREAIKQEKSTHEIESIAKDSGMLTLKTMASTYCETAHNNFWAAENL